MLRMIAPDLVPLAAVWMFVLSFAALALVGFDHWCETCGRCGMKKGPLLAEGCECREVRR